MPFKHLATLVISALTLAFQSLKAGEIGDLTYEIVGETVTITQVSHFASGAVVIPLLIEGKPVTRIGVGACYSRNLITSLNLPPSLKRIDTSAFSLCRKLVTCNLPEGIQEIDDDAFSYCMSLGQVTIPSTVTDLGIGLFTGCQKLQAVRLPENLAVIPDRMFSACPSLKTLRIPPKVKSIGSGAFSASGLTNLTIPASVTSLGADNFSGCRALARIVFKGELARIEAGTFAICSSLSKIKLPSKVTHIGDGAFRESAISQINLEGVETIGSRAFESCAGLLTASFPKKLKMLGSRAFYTCANLASVTFAGDAPKMGKQAFTGSNPEFKIFISEESRGFTLNRWKGYKTSLPAGEIHIQSDKGSVLGDGQKVEFGSFVTGRKGPLKNFTITNVGNLPLTNISAILDSADAADYQIIIPLKTRLAPGANAQLGIKFTPKERGKRTATLVISSSDRNENPFTMNLSGRGLFLLE